MAAGAAGEGRLLASEGLTGCQKECGDNDGVEHVAPGPSRVNNNNTQPDLTSPAPAAAAARPVRVEPPPGGGIKENNCSKEKNVILA